MFAMIKFDGKIKIVKDMHFRFVTQYKNFFLGQFN